MTHELFKILPVLPVETPISLPDPIPSRVMSRPGSEEDDGIISLNLAAEIQLRGIHSIIGEVMDRGRWRWRSGESGRSGKTIDNCNGMRNRKGDAKARGRNTSVSILIARMTFRRGN